MAADWIKVRIDLQSHPKVVRILSALAADKFRVIGGLHAVWSVFDTHSIDGILPGYTPDAMDHIIGWPGFSQAMIAVDWLVFDGEKTLSMPEFTEHNGKSAKRRAEDQKRKKQERICPQSVRKPSAPAPDKMRTREREREEQEQEQEQFVESDDPTSFDAFWAEYPSKVGKKPARDKWNQKRLERTPLASSIIADVTARKQRHGKWLDGFVPNPATYLQQERWNDPIEPRHPQPQRPGQPPAAAPVAGHSPEAPDTPEARIRAEAEFCRAQFQLGTLTELQVNARMAAIRAKYATPSTTGDAP